MKTDLIHTFIVPEEQAGVRLDKFLSSLSVIASRTRATELIDRGLVTIKGRSVKPAHKVLAFSEITVQMPEPTPTELQPLDMPLEILFEDADVVVINKPSGLVVHPAAGHAQDTLVNILLHHVDSLSMGFGEQRPGIVHRLDRDTSGILVVAKNDSAHRSLSDQFRNKTAHRMYHALVHGTMKKKFGTFTSHLARDPKSRQRFASTGTDHGKIAITHFEVLQTVPANLSLIQCRLETGRTHQIRVHLSEAGHPLVGDVIYGNRSQKKPADRELGRLGLHAVELGFQHPRTHEALFFKKEWPEQMAVFARAKGFRDV